MKTISPRAATLKKQCVDHLIDVFVSSNTVEYTAGRLAEAKHLCEKHDDSDACKLWKKLDKIMIKQFGLHDTAISKIKKACGHTGEG